MIITLKISYIVTALLIVVNSCSDAFPEQAVEMPVTTGYVAQVSEISSWKGKAAFPRLAALPRYALESPPRIYDKPMLDFVPSGEYKAVYPYIGQGSGYYGFYGFADANGRIICEPVYNNVSLVTYEDKSAYVVSRKVFPDGIDLEREDLGAVGLVAIISADGAFYAEYDDVYTVNRSLAFDNDEFIFNPILTCEYEYIPVKKGCKWGAVGFDGTEALPCAYPNAPLFSEGLAAVYVNADRLETLDEYFEAKIPYNYIDAYGNIMLGPYERPPNAGESIASDMPYYYFRNLEAAVFNNGRAMNFDKDGKYGFIDKSGKLVIPRVYTLVNFEQFGWNKYGLALVCLADVTELENEWETWYQFRYGNENVNNAQYFLIDVNGTHIAEWECRMMSIYDRGDYYRVWNDQGRISAVFDHAGNAIPIEGDRAFWNGYSIGEQANDTWRVSGNGVSNTVNASYIDWLLGDWFSCYDSATGAGRIWNAQTGEERPGHYYAYSHGQDASICTQNLDAGYSKTRYGVMNDAGEVLIDFKFDWLSKIGDKYYAVQGNYGGLLDEGGEWFVKVPMLENFD